jgi:hypothetical protein
MRGYLIRSPTAKPSLNSNPLLLAFSPVVYTEYGVYDIPGRCVDRFVLFSSRKADGGVQPRQLRLRAGSALIFILLSLSSVRQRATR